MFLLGLILLLVGFVLGIHILWIVGLVLLLIGVALFAAGSLDRPVGGRRHWW